MGSAGGGECQSSLPLCVARGLVCSRSPLRALRRLLTSCSRRAAPGADVCVPQIQIGHTFKVARLVALEATHRKVKAYVRIQHPFYNCKESGQHDEKAEVKPEGVVGTWWHETLRALGAIQE